MVFKTDRGDKMNNELMVMNKQALSEMMEAATAISNSGLIPAALRNKPADILVIMQTAREMNIPPMQAINSINVIQGRLSISPQLMIALFRQKLTGGFLKIEINETKKEAIVICSRSKENMDESYKSTWNVEKAKLMGLLGKDNYIKQLTNMLKWRAVAEAIRVVAPDVIMGLYLPDEIEDIVETANKVEGISSDVIISEEEIKKEEALKEKVKNEYFMYKIDTERQQAQIKEVLTLLGKCNIPDAEKVKFVQENLGCRTGEFKTKNNAELETFITILNEYIADKAEKKRREDLAKQQEVDFSDIPF
jgi:hypothetical protein